MEPKPNAFGTFLETIQQGQTQPATTPDSLALLTELARVHSEPLTTLVKGGADTPSLMVTLLNMSQMGLIQVQGDDVVVTEKGLRVAEQLAS